MGDFLNNLVSAAAGYLGNEQKNDAALEIAKLGLAQTQAATVQATQTAAASQWIPGVGNGVVIAGGAAMLALVLVVSLVRK